jgi:hypothetical protein
MKLWQSLRLRRRKEDTLEDEPHPVLPEPEPDARAAKQRMEQRKHDQEKRASRVPLYRILW